MIFASDFIPVILTTETFVFIQKILQLCWKKSDNDIVSKMVAKKIKRHSKDNLALKYILYALYYALSLAETEQCY